VSANGDLTPLVSGLTESPKKSDTLV